MKFVFLSLAIIATLVASYFTITQTEKFQEVKTLRLETIKENISLSGSILDREDKIKTEEKNKKDAEQALSEVQAKVSVLKSDNNVLENQVAQLDVELSAQEVKLGALKQVVAGVKAEFAQVGIDTTLGSIHEDFKTLTTSIETKQGTDKGLDESIAADEKKLADKRNEIDRFNGRIQARDTRIAQNEIEARITAVNHDWGFVMVGAGSNSGFNPDTVLLVKRDGRLIGRVKPSSIEPTQTVADIEFSSLAPGVRFQLGDQVMLEKPANN